MLVNESVISLDLTSLFEMFCLLLTQTHNTSYSHQNVSSASGIMQNGLIILVSEANHSSRAVLCDTHTSSTATETCTIFTLNDMDTVSNSYY